MPPGAKYTALGIGSWNSLLYSWAFLRPTAKRPSGMAVLVGPGGARMVASPGRKGTGPYTMEPPRCSQVRCSRVSTQATTLVGQAARSDPISASASTPAGEVGWVTDLTGALIAVGGPGSG